MLTLHSIRCAAAVGLALATAANAAPEPTGPVHRIGAVQAARLALEQGGTFQARVADLALQWRYLLDVARGEFRPKTSVTLASQRARGTSSSASPTSTLYHQAGLEASWKFRSGMQLNAQLDGDRQRQSPSEPTAERRATIGMVLPLLRGSGYEINGANLRSTELSLESARVAFRQAAVDAVYQILVQYFDRRIAQLQADVARESLQSATQVDDLSRTLIEVGRSAPVARLQSRADMAQAEISLAQALNTERQSLRSLLVGIGLDVPAEGVTVETPDNPDDVLPAFSLDEAAAMAQALQTDATVLTARLTLEDARLRLRVAEDNLRLPLQLDVSRSTTRNTADGLNRGETKVGLSTSIELDRSELRYSRSSAAVSERRAEIELQDAERNARAAAVDAVRQQDFAVRQLALTQANIEVARQRYESELDRFRLGRASALELSLAQQAMNSSRVSLLQSQFEALVARLGILKVAGRLLETVGLQTQVDRWSRGEP